MGMHDRDWYWRNKEYRDSGGHIPRKKKTGEITTFGAFVFLFVFAIIHYVVNS